jgi:hypothetical protein
VILEGGRNGFYNQHKGGDDIRANSHYVKEPRNIVTWGEEKIYSRSISRMNFEVLV